MVFGNFNIAYTTDKISTRLTDSVRFRETMPINVKNNLSVSGFVGVGMPLIKQILRMNANTNLSYRQGISVVNDIENTTKTVGASLSLRLNLNIKDTFDVSLSGRIQTNRTTYSFQTTANQQFYNHDYEIDANYRLPHGFKLNANLDYTLITGGTFGTSQAIPIFGASVSKFFLKKERGELKLSVIDALNRNTGINRTATDNYIQNEVTQSLGRYVMLSFTYALNPMMGGGGGRGGRPMIMMNRN